MTCTWVGNHFWACSDSIILGFYFVMFFGFGFFFGGVGGCCLFVCLFVFLHRVQKRRQCPSRKQGEPGSLITASLRALQRAWGWGSGGDGGAAPRSLRADVKMTGSDGRGPPLRGSLSSAEGQGSTSPGRPVQASARSRTPRVAATVPGPGAPAAGPPPGAARLLLRPG